MLARNVFVLACLAAPLLEVSASNCLCGHCCDAPTQLDVQKGACVLPGGTVFCSLGCPHSQAPVLCRAEVVRGLSLTPGGVSSQSLSNLRVTETFVREHTRVWRELNDRAKLGLEARLFNVPEYYNHFDYTMSVPLNTLIRKDTEYNFRCGADPCEVVVFLYECHPCQSEKGGLPARLLSDGFVRSRCAPTFTNGQTDTQHQLIAYSKIIDKPAASGTYEYVFTSDADVEFLIAAFSESSQIKECDGLSQGECDATHDRCVYRGGRCLRNKCFMQGPGTGCNTDTCLKKELA